MSRSSSSNVDSKVYVGDLGNNASKGELEDAFSYYGRLKSVWVARNPPGFAFIEYEDPRDAEDAVRGLDGRNVCGRRVRVELSTGRTRSSRGYSGPSRRGRPFHPEDRCYECGGRGHYARDCPQYSRGKKRSVSRSRSRSRSRGRRSASGSRGRDSRGRSRSYSRSRSRSRRKSDSRSRSHSKSVHRDSRDRSKSKSRDHSRERSKSRTSNRDSRSKSRSRSPSKSRRSSRSRSARSNSRSPSRASE